MAEIASRFRYLDNGYMGGQTPLPSSPDDPVQQVLAAFGHRDGYKIVRALLRSPKRQADLVKEDGVPQATASSLLAEMRALRVLAPGGKAGVHRIAFPEPTVAILEAVAVLIDAIDAQRRKALEAMRSELSEDADGP